MLVGLPAKAQAAPSGGESNWLLSILIYNAQLELPGFRAVKQPPGLVQVRSIFQAFEGSHPIPPGLLTYRASLTCLDAPTKRLAAGSPTNGGNLEGPQLPTSPEYSKSFVNHV